MTSRLLITAVLAVLPVVAVATTGGTATADAAPTRDPRAAAVLTLCDAQGRPETSGSVGTAPFVQRVVGASAAPGVYAAAGRSATLYAFQPRAQVAPDQWSGELLTAATRYSEPAHPTAVATGGDVALQDFLEGYPARLDGLVQLRLYLTVPGQPPLQTRYDALDLRVEGGHWTALERGTASCDSGRAVSRESLLLPHRATAPSVGSQSAGRERGRSSGSDAPTTPIRTYATPSSAARPAADVHTTGGNGTSVPLVTWLAGGVAVVLAALLLLARRRTRSTSDT